MTTSLSTSTSGARLSALLLLGAGSIFSSACTAPARPGDDAGPSASDAPPADALLSDVPGLDAPGTDAGSAADGGGVCDPTPGPSTGGGYRDLFELAVFTSDGDAPRAHLYGRLRPDALAPGGCAVIDEVEVQRGGVAIGTLTGSGAYSVDSDSALLAAGPPLPEMTTRCSGDTERFGGFGFVVRGRISGGSFEARCAEAEGGSRWPPAVRVTCHHGIEARPRGGYGMVSTSALFSSTMLAATVVHGPGAALLTVEASAHIIPGFASGAFGPPPPTLDPFDAAFDMASVSESTLPGTRMMTSTANLFASSVVLPLAICPPPSTGIPGPGDPLPPVFLARLRGTSERGAFSTEVYVNSCTTLSSP